MTRWLISVCLPVLLGCGGGRIARPDAPSAASATGRDSCGRTGTLVLEPLVVDMQPEKRADIETALAEARGLVAVHYTCAEFVVLRDCRVRGTYSTRSLSPKTQLTTMTTVDEVHATLPVGMARLIAAKGGVSRRASIDLELTMAATTAAADGTFDPGALQGACDGATHVVQSATFGAFRLTQASRGAVDGEVSSLGTSASASSSDGKRTLAKEGSAAACEAPGGGSLTRGCDAVLRVALAPLGAQLPPVDLRSHRDIMRKVAPCKDGIDRCRSRCEMREARACFELGSYIGSADLPVFDPVAAARALHRGCTFGSAEACSVLGIHYMTAGNPVESTTLGWSLCERGCKLGNAIGCFTLFSSSGDVRYRKQGCYLEPKASECEALR